MTSVCFEALASAWLSTKKKLLPEPPDEQVFTAQDNLEQCRKSMELREKEIQDSISKLSKEAVARNKAGDKMAAKLKMAERARHMKRLEKLRSSMNIIDTQLDAIKSSELDKEIMMSLRASTIALKKAGIGVNVNEVENVMNELDDQMKEMQDITSVLANPVATAFDDENSIDEELAALMLQEGQPVLTQPTASNSMPLYPVKEEPASTIPQSDEIDEEPEKEAVKRPLLQAS